jgi:hypothetical protein
MDRATKGLYDEPAMILAFKERRLGKERRFGWALRMNESLARNAPETHYPEDRFLCAISF